MMRCFLDFVLATPSLILDGLKRDTSLISCCFGKIKDHKEDSGAKIALDNSIPSRSAGSSAMLVLMVGAGADVLTTQGICIQKVSGAPG